ARREFPGVSVAQFGAEFVADAVSIRHRYRDGADIACGADLQSGGEAVDTRWMLLWRDWGTSFSWGAPPPGAREHASRGMGASTQGRGAIDPSGATGEAGDDPVPPQRPARGRSIRRHHVVRYGAASLVPGDRSVGCVFLHRQHTGAGQFLPHL